MFDCIDEDGPVTIGVVIDETALASDIARLVAGLALLAGDHAELNEPPAAPGPEYDATGHTAATFTQHTPGTSATLVPLHRAPGVPFALLQTPAERTADQLSHLPARPGPHAIQYRTDRVAHHGGEYVAPGRHVVTGTWRYPSPEVCRDDRRTGVWIGPPDRPFEQALVCVSCGLDCT